MLHRGGALPTVAPVTSCPPTYTLLSRVLYVKELLSMLGCHFSSLSASGCGSLSVESA